MCVLSRSGAADGFGDGALDLFFVYRRNSSNVSAVRVFARSKRGKGKTVTSHTTRLRVSVNNDWFFFFSIFANGVAIIQETIVFVSRRFYSLVVPTTTVSVEKRASLCT